jgi:hypothetical protein
MSDTTEIPTSDAFSNILLRPPHVLHDLPVEYRWEFTRRHPYYLSNWNFAHRYHVGGLKDPLEIQLGKAAVIMLLGIGVTADPPAPSAGVEALQIGQLSKGWKDGAVGLVSYRGMAGNVLMDLPRAARRFVGEILSRSADTEDDERHERFDLMLELMTHADSSLDAMPKRPVVGINITSPQRATLGAIEELVKEWKQTAGIDEKRRRDDVLKDYLIVWDAYEGWRDDHYEIKGEHTFQQISNQLSVPRRTVASRYYSAFRLISGHDYTFADWVKLFLVVKLAEHPGIKSLHRRKSSAPGRRSGGGPAPVPETALQPNQSPGRSGIIENESARLSELPLMDIVIDVGGLIEKGWSDQQIIDEMEFENAGEAGKLVAHLRRRLQDPAT